MSIRRLLVRPIPVSHGMHDAKPLEVGHWRRVELDEVCRFDSEVTNKAVCVLPLEVTLFLVGLITVDRAAIFPNALRNEGVLLMDGIVSMKRKFVNDNTCVRLGSGGR